MESSSSLSLIGRSGNSLVLSRSLTLDLDGFDIIETLEDVDLVSESLTRLLVEVLLYLDADEYWDLTGSTSYMLGASFESLVVFAGLDNTDLGASLRVDSDLSLLSECSFSLRESSFSFEGSCFRLCHN